MMAELKIYVEEKFKTTSCITCGCTIVLNEDHYNHKLENQTYYYCPNGHSQHFIGETEEKRLRRELDAERKKKEWALKDVENKQKEINRLRTRSKNGVCPCCKCSFVSLRRHMKSKHPEFKG